MAGSCIMHVTWSIHTGLPEILNHNEQWTPILGACKYTKLHIQWHTHCCYGRLNSLSHTLLHSHCNNTVNIPTLVVVGFCLCKFYYGILVWGLCLSTTTKFFVWLIQFNVCSLCYGWWCLWFEFRQVLFVAIWDR